MFMITAENKTGMLNHDKVNEANGCVERGVYCLAHSLTDIFAV